MKYSIHALLAASVLAVAFNAAASVSTAGIGNLQVTVTDLAPSDGIMPTFSAYLFSSSAAVQVYGNSQNSFDYGLNASIALSPSHYATNKSSTNTLVDLVQYSFTTSPAAMSAIAFGSTLVEGYFTLSPGAMVTLSGDLSVFRNSTDNYAAAGMSLFAETDTIRQGSSVDLTATDLTPSDTKSLSTYFINSGMTTITGGIRMYTSTSALSAVPEPENAALLLGGLSLIAFTACRRKK